MVWLSLVAHIAFGYPYGEKVTSFLSLGKVLKTYIADPQPLPPGSNWEIIIDFIIDRFYY